ncbi:MAG: hypothetical protein H0V98_05110 [Chloroflexia bacterium]|jgi:hypothetical protein|nr:hypothetical protein [Chloroflexia bacterium]
MTVDGRLEGVQRYTIHGGSYARLFFSHADDPETIIQAQLPEESWDGNLEVGDRIVITYLLKTVMEIRRASADSTNT